MYTTSNFRYLRISKTKVLPVNLLLSKEDLEWFNDYSFQEILTVLKPLLLGRIALYEQGHITKRSIAPTNNINQSLDDGLDDAGIILGGKNESTASAAQGSGSEAIPGANTSKGKRRRGEVEAIGGTNWNKSERPQFSVRYGMRPTTNSERGGAILVADKKLGFTMVKKEQEDEAAMLEGASQRSLTELAALEGEAGSGVEKTIGDVAIREEDESDNLRVSDFQRSKSDEDEDETIQEDDDGEDGDYRDQRGSKRKKSARNTKLGAKGNRSKSDSGMSQSQLDQKPTLQVNYSPLKLYPQTLYIVVRTLGSSNVKVDIAASSSSSGGRADKLPGEQGDDGSLFPPELDYFLS
ncbi:hypothetical protein BGZ80_003217 [Entomortierella chlamydospora]|uniref:Uncharacterized protein n=1 Tax=Entomortierella chlamydospora TaxID=101097 RepID=A0A9P6N0T5_9FUNG|nr:hypothetical protein BGZ79_011143 [Entomortierella chlamydospora]KAG0021012.1 hypothetical protein BGZ80_003217 [Entomortierella chlamydospora]